MAMTSQTETEHTEFPSSCHLLSEGLLTIYKPGLDNCKSRLKELTTKQTVVITALSGENLELAKMQQSRMLQDLFITLSTCQKKLINVKKDMKSLYERSSRLRKQALKLEEFKREKLNV